MTTLLRRCCPIFALSSSNRPSSSTTSLRSIPLSYQCYGDISDREAPPLVIAHGLFGQKNNWNSLAKALQVKLRNQIFVVDMRNHGDSAWTETMSYSEMALDLSYFIRQVVQPQSRFDEICLLGHSMGGKAAVLFSMEHPELLRKLIVEDVAPKIYHRERSQIPGFIQEAERMFGDYSNLSDARRAVDEHLLQTIKSRSIRQFLLTNLVERTDGKLCWRINLAVIERFIADIMGFALVADCSQSYYGPTLFIYGSKSSYVSPKDHKLTRQYFPRVQFHVITGAGHWIHIDKPGDFIRSVERFILEN